MLLTDSSFLIEPLSVFLSIYLSKLFSLIEELSPLLGTTSIKLNFSDVASEAVLNFSHGGSKASFTLEERGNSLHDSLESSTETSV